MNPLVTIGMPTYNRRDGYFPQALASALAQDYEDLEVVVCDNASTDGTKEYMEAMTDPRLRYVRHAENIGANANFNSCLENARGEYFLLLHDDDLLDPTFVSRCVAALEGRLDLGLVRTGSRVIGSHGQVLSANRTNTAGMSAADVVLTWFRRKTPLYLASTLYNTAHLRAAGGFVSPHGLYQDVKATVLLMARHGHVDVDDVLASFRKHDDNRGTTAGALKWAEDAVHLLDVIVTEFPDRAEELRTAGSNYLSRQCYRFVATIPDLGERWRAYRQVERMFGGSASPVAFEVRRHWRRYRSRLGRAVRGLTGERAPVR